MRIRLNGTEIDTAAETLAELIAAEGFTPEIVATAVDGEFVPRGERAATRLAVNAEVEVFSPRQGG